MNKYYYFRPSECKTPGGERIASNILQVEAQEVASDLWQQQQRAKVHLLVMGLGAVAVGFMALDILFWAIIGGMISFVGFTWIWPAVSRKVQRTAYRRACEYMDAYSGGGRPARPVQWDEELFE